MPACTGSAADLSLVALVLDTGRFGLHELNSRACFDSKQVLNLLLSESKESLVSSVGPETQGEALTYC